MRKTIKKGFTLVELLVVIAIIAILSIVGIVGYVSFTTKARISNDTTIVTELNRVLQAEHVTKKPDTMQEIVDEVYKNGFVLSRLTPTASKHHIVYDIVKDRFFLLNDKYKVVGGDLDGKDLTGDAWDHWKVIHSYSEINDEHFSYYLGEMTDNEPAEGLLVHNGIDVGENTVNKIKYENKTTTGKKVIVRTKGSALIVDAQNDTVKHYGDGTVLNIEAVDTQNCYREFGTFENAQIKTGRIVFEKEDAKIENLLLIAKTDKSGFEDIIVETRVGASLPVLDRTEVNIAEKGTLVLNVVTPTSDEFIYLTKAGVIEQVVVTTEVVDTSAVDVTTVESAKAASETSTQTYNASEQIANVGNKNANGDYVDANNEVIIYSNGTVAEGKNPANIAVEAKADEEAVSNGTTYFAGGVGTQKSPYYISNAIELGNINTSLDAYYEVINDIDMSVVESWTPIGTMSTPFKGHFDGKNYSIKNWTTDSPLFGMIKGSDSILESLANTDVVDSNNQLIASVGESGFNCIVKNIIIKDSDLTLDMYMGGVSNYVMDAYVADCKIVNSKIFYSNGYDTGAFFGEAYRSHIKGLYLASDNVIICSSSPTYFGNTGLMIGAVAGNGIRNYLKATIENGANYGGTGIDYLKASNRDFYYTIINDCINDSSAQLNYNYGWVGAIVGTTSSYSRLQVIIDCVNNGALSVKNLESKISIGGICGGAGGGGTINFVRCSNTGNITITGNDSYESTINGYDILAGICAYANGPFIDCSNSGTLTGNVKYLAGICGRTNDSATAVIFNNCSNTGSLDSEYNKANKYGLCAYVPNSTGKTIHVYNQDLSNLSINGSNFTFHNGDTVSGIFKPTSSQTVNADPSAYSVVDLSAMSSGTITWNVSNSDITIWGSAQNVSFDIKGENNTVSIAENAEIKDLTITGSGNTVRNNGKIRNMFSKSSAEIVNNSIMAGIYITGSDSDNVHLTNRGTITGDGWADYPYPVQTASPVAFVFDNYGTVNSKVAFALLFYGEASVTVNVYKDSKLSSTNSGLVVFTNGGLDTQIAHSFTINVEEGTVNGVNGNYYYNITSGTVYSTSHNKSCDIVINFDVNFDE